MHVQMVMQSCMNLNNIDFYCGMCDLICGGMVKILRDKYSEEEAESEHFRKVYKGEWRSKCKIKAHKDGSQVFD